MQLVYLHVCNIESPKSEFCSSISRSSGVRGRCRGVRGAPRAQSLQNSRLHAATECRIVLPRAERRTKWQIGTSSSGRTADSGSVNGSSTLSVPAILPSQLHMWPVRLAVQDAALSRRRSPVRIWYGLPKQTSANTVLPAVSPIFLSKFGPKKSLSEPALHGICIRARLFVGPSGGNPARLGGILDVQSRTLAPGARPAGRDATFSTRLGAMLDAARGRASNMPPKRTLVLPA